ncbi:signal peptidase I [Cellulomonas sp. KH9]|uniref:signal peptidase I n=1 Tax=Cellulomonas sp. KH9 TaxID=1855324 RepID=UPI0008E706B5|nr:signal peptidase I [Cellulomonas sp. KH9]SFJ80597.1 signal peptidase, endoplasmic reticulum-type [Cellulomonas sp. KH9]
MSTRKACRRDSRRTRALSALTTCALLAVLAAVVALAVVPRLLGGAALTVLTGSMVPTYQPGDVVVVRGVEDAAAEVEVGDVVTFQPVSDDPALVTHRVVGKSLTSDGTAFVTRGDANTADDDPLLPEQIKGIAVYHVPFVGHVSLWLGGHRGTLVVAVAGALITYSVLMLLRPERAPAPIPGPGPIGRRGDDLSGAPRGDRTDAAPVPTPGGAP